jgi:hypothetical protein
MFANLQPDEQLYIALYELSDDELIGLLLQHGAQVRFCRLPARSSVGAMSNSFVRRTLAAW